MPSVCLIDTQMCLPPSGGPNYFLLTLAAHLVRRGWRVWVIGQPGPHRQVLDKYLAEGISVLENVWATGSLPEEKAECLGEWAERTRPDVFLISNCTDAAWLALPGLPKTVRTISVAHHNVAAYYQPVQHYAPFIDCAVGVSPQIAERLTELTAPERCRYIPYGVDILSADRFAARLAREDHALRIGYVGRLVEEQKRLSRLVPIAAELSRRAIPFHLQLIGDGPDRPAVERAFREHGLHEHVSFPGWLDRDALAQRYAELDVLVMVSDAEGLPIALLEAMGHGAVPVVSDVQSGMTSVIRNGENGFLLSKHDTQGFADRVELLARDVSRRRAMQAKSWETSQDYSVERMVSAYETLFRDLLSSDHGRPDGPVADGFPVMPSCRSRYPYWLRKAKRLFLATAGK
jgi:glycosyltransferase involved in cell wall biosynthesis